MLVFPTTGKRPLENMMSGGDLDGDVYMIIWDKEIVQQAIQKDPFPDPSPSENKVWEEKYTEEMKQNSDIASSITAYFKRDMLGQMSNLHLNCAIQNGLSHNMTEKAAFLCSV